MNYSHANYLRNTILTKIFTDRQKILGIFWDVGNFYHCRLQLPRNFGSVILANLPTRVPLCLLNNAKAPVGMTDLKNQKDFWGIGNVLPLPTSNSGEFVW